MGLDLCYGFGKINMDRNPIFNEVVTWTAKPQKCLIIFSFKIDYFKENYITVKWGNCLASIIVSTCMIQVKNKLGKNVTIITHYTVPTSGKRNPAVDWV